MCVGLLLAAPARGQETGTQPAATASDPAADAAIARRLQSYGPPAPRKTCGVPDASGDIVVCATDNSQYRVQSTGDSNRRSKEALNTGIPRAPNASSLPDCSQGGCIGIGGVPPPIYYVNFDELPEAPEGSEADEIAKGEKPAP